MASFFVASKIIIFITVCVYVLTGNELSAGTVFMAICLYGAVRLTITLFFPFAIEKLSESLISIRRIKVSVSECAACPGGLLLMVIEMFNVNCQNFLLLDEVDPQHQGLPVAEKKDCMVTIQDLSCYWDMVRQAFLFPRLDTV